MNLLKRILLALSTGYIAFFINERVFWSFPRPADTLGELVMTWLVYSFFVYTCLIVLHAYRVRSIWAIFLVGALLGWLVEGVFALTTFGFNFPFPYSIPWTALAWHASAFLVMWYLMLRALATSTIKTLIAAIALGVFWGTWSLAWPINYGDVATTTSDIFLMNGLICTALYIFTLHSFHLLKASTFTPSRIEMMILGGLLLILYVVHTIPVAIPLVGIVMPLTLLPLLFGIIYLGLRKNKRDETEPNAFALVDAKIPLWRSVLLLLAPCIAALIFNTGMYMNTNIFYSLVLTPLGSLLFIWSLYKVLRRHEMTPTDADKDS